jgi:hypothetical protein
MKTPNIEVLAPNIEKYNSQYSPIYKRTRVGQADGTKWDGIGNMLGNTFRTWGKCLELITNSWELSEKLMGTYWEQQKSNSPAHPPKEWVYWLYAAIPHWPSKISISNCVHHLFWPRLMAGAWLVRTELLPYLENPWNNTAPSAAASIRKPRRIQLPGATVYTAHIEVCNPRHNLQLPLKLCKDARTLIRNISVGWQFARPPRKYSDILNSSLNWYDPE